MNNQESQQIPNSQAPTGKTRRKLTKKQLIIAVTLAGLVVVGGVTYAVLAQRDAEIARLSPQYDTILPKNTSIDSLGGWKRVSPPESEPVFAYTDTINDVPISVSQQQIPETFKGSVDKSTTKLAEAYRATEAFKVGNMKVHIGTSSKGPQSVIFTQNELLILIKSQKSVPNDSWKRYIESLN